MTLCFSILSWNFNLRYVALDCHEYTRDTRSYREKGMVKWPILGIDCANHPLLGEEYYQEGVKWCNDAIQFMTNRGYQFNRYLVGGALPDWEQRYSTLEATDARNSLAANHCLSFVAESSIIRHSKDVTVELEERIDSFLSLFEFFLNDVNRLKRASDYTDKLKKQPLPANLPVNFFWGSTGDQIQQVPAIITATGERVENNAPNLMTERIIKERVVTPLGYAIPVSESAIYQEWAKHNGITFDIRPASELPGDLEFSRLEGVEQKRDKIYNREGKRQIVIFDHIESPLGQDTTNYIYFHLKGPQSLRSAMMMEPRNLYGLFSSKPLRKTIPDSGILPIIRVVDPEL